MTASPLAPSSGWNSIMVRAIVLAPLAMALWWFVLKGPSLLLLRWLAWLPLAMVIAPPGHAPVRVDPSSPEWTFNAAVNDVGKNLRTGAYQRIDSVEFAIHPNSIAAFAGGWFLYLALAGAAGAFTRAQVRQLVKGLALQITISVLCLMAAVYVSGYGSVINTDSRRGAAIWLLNYLHHLIYLVIPFAGPFLVAVLVHPAWRDYFRRPPIAGPASEARPHVAPDARRRRARQVRKH